jgi:hypothetical protein
MDPDQAREAHPVAALFPMLADDELYDMTLDIQERGLLQPIVLDAEGRILDGRNRYEACKLGGVKPQFETYAGDDPAGYALTVNITRRHLTTGARAVLAAQYARLNDASYKSVTDDQAKLTKTRIAEASLVLDWAPDLATEVVAGVKPLSVAVTAARERKRETEAREVKMARVRAAAADLAELVGEGRMDLDEAIAALDLREERARQAASEQQRQAAEQERKQAEDQRDARALLGRIIDLIAPQSMSEGFIESWAERLGDLDPSLIKRTGQAAQALTDLAERITR